jgi:hypothetical protein
VPRAARSRAIVIHRPSQNGSPNEAAKYLFTQSPSVQRSVNFMPYFAVNGNQIELLETARLI